MQVSISRRQSETRPGRERKLYTYAIAMGHKNHSEPGPNIAGNRIAWSNPTSFRTLPCTETRATPTYPLQGTVCSTFRNRTRAVNNRIQASRSGKLMHGQVNHRDVRFGYCFITSACGPVMLLQSDYLRLCHNVCHQQQNESERPSIIDHVC